MTTGVLISAVERGHLSPRTAARLVVLRIEIECVLARWRVTRWARSVRRWR